MTSLETSVAGVGLRWSLDTVATAAERLVTTAPSIADRPAQWPPWEANRQAQEWSDWHDLADVVLRDAFISADLAESFRDLDPPVKLGFLRSLPHDLTDAPRRWPVDLGLGQVPPRRLDGESTRRDLARVLSWLEERCYFARELGSECVDVHDDDSRRLVDVITSRLDLALSPTLRSLFAEVDTGRLAEIVAVAREYIAMPPGRTYHSWNDCGLHPRTGRWDAEMGRRVLDDLVATIAEHSDLGALLLASQQIGAAVPAPVPVDPLRRTGPATHAPAEAFLPHGSVLTVTRLVTRLAAQRHLDALEAFLRAHRVHVESTGDTTSPDFVLVVEILQDDQARLRRHEQVLTGTLSELAGYAGWTIRYTRPPEYRRALEVATLDPAAIAVRLEREGRPHEGAIALRSSFRFRPRPGLDGGVHLVVIVDDLDDPGGQVLEDAVWRVHAGPRAARAASGLEPQLAEALRPRGLRSLPDRRPRVAVVTSRGHVGSDIAPKLDGDVLDVDYRTFAANSADAAVRLATTLRSLASDATLDGVLIARGGGDQSDLNRLVTPEVQTAISSVRQSGKTVVLAIGHGTFASTLDVDFEALTPGDAAHAIRAILVDFPANKRAAIAATQERLAANPPTEEWPAIAAREQESLRQRLAAIELDHDARLATMRQR
ncbi:exodeoxyribonuclease VII large subunit [Dactylosporangium sp. CA-152071]|uniref:exodeoxyribonuclease VII large subunit n=1 Tax=Dactylosporangium sp. CA-152071 TaxID=3239933 RepID=UPI003D92003E